MRGKKSKGDDNFQQEAIKSYKALFILFNLTRGEPWLVAFTLPKSNPGLTNSGSPRVSLCSVNRA